MAISRYTPVSGDIVLSGFPTTIDAGNGVRGCVILTNRSDTGSAWRYVVRYGYQFLQVGYMDMSYAYITLNSLSVGGGYAEYKATDNIPGYVTMSPGYYMLSGTTAIIVPYGASITGSVSVTAHNVFNTGNWSYGSNFNTGGTAPASPIPAVPVLNFPQPSSVTSTSLYLNSYFNGDSRQRDYYYMSMTRVGVGYIDNPAHTGTNGNQEYYTKTLTGLTPETTYSFKADLKDKNGVIKGTITRTATTLSQAKIYYKVNGAWQITFPYIRVNGTWRRSKQTYMKVNGVWKRSKDQ